MGKKIITTPLTDDIILKLNAGDEVLISGTLFWTGAAHKVISLRESSFDIRGGYLLFRAVSCSRC